MGVMDKIKGRAKEAVGGATHNKSLKAEGKADQAVGKVKDAVDAVKEKASDAMKAAKEK
jgi:uncharacterized protein YjbJ (UPF0337 family)